MRILGKGDELAARFRVEAVLGAGAYGVVYRVWDPALMQRRAVKVFRAVDELGLSASQAERSRQRFLAEARTLAALSHPNVVRIYDVDASGERPHIVMDYLGGRTLAEKFRAHETKTLPAGELLALLGAIARPLAYLHSRTPPVLHRDLKLSNIIVDDDAASVHLIDFGLAKIDGDSTFTESGTSIGTAVYWAPEYARAFMSGGESRHSTQTDVWALGVIALVLLTGAYPYYDENRAALAVKIAAADGSGPLSLPPGLPRSLTDLLSSMLAPDPRERLRDGSAVLDAIGTTEAGLASRRSPIFGSAVGLDPSRNDQITCSWPIERRLLGGNLASAYTTGGASIACQYDARTWVGWCSGSLAAESTDVLIEAFDRPFSSGAQIERELDYFLDWSELRSYVASSRTAQMRWVLERRSRIRAIHVFTSLKSTAMGVAVARLTLGGIVEVHETWPSYERAFRERNRV